MNCRIDIEAEGFNTAVTECHIEATGVGAAVGIVVELTGSVLPRQFTGPADIAA